ncbi:MAG: sulfurtransferase complex subunit TusC [Spirochaetota bacterium]|nr:sulfurtransferase complex subunit TusC [Spirochaetota bacterium]
MEDEIIQKKMMFIMRRAPHGSIYSYEGLEVVLITAAYDQDISMTFIDDGVFALKKDQNTDGIGIKGFMKTYFALDDYDVQKLYVSEESLSDRGLKRDDLIDINIQIMSQKEITNIMNEQDVLFPF